MSFFNQSKANPFIRRGNNPFINHGGINVPAVGMLEGVTPAIYKPGFQANAIAAANVSQANFQLAESENDSQAEAPYNRQKGISQLFIYLSFQFS